jgi:hypothetical protein
MRGLGADHRTAPACDVMISLLLTPRIYALRISRK